MNHETLEALYQLDVAEIGEKEAAKRWEYWTGRIWQNNRDCTGVVPPQFNLDLPYRRKPGIPWPKVMQDCESEFERGKTAGYCLGFVAQERAQLSWPDDAPEWADRLTRIFYSTVTFQSESQPYVFKPKPAKQKIDWSKLRINGLNVGIDMSNPTSDWIAWNCDENTRGNPLPDGLVVEWIDNGSHAIYKTKPIWGCVRAFRIVGIQENFG